MSKEVSKTHPGARETRNQSNRESSAPGRDWVGERQNSGRLFSSVILFWQLPCPVTASSCTGLQGLRAPPSSCRPPTVAPAGLLFLVQVCPTPSSALDLLAKLTGDTKTWPHHNQLVQIFINSSTDSFVQWYLSPGHFFLLLPFSIKTCVPSFQILFPPRAKCRS